MTPSACTDDSNIKWPKGHEILKWPKESKLLCWLGRSLCSSAFVLLPHVAPCYPSACAQHCFMPWWHRSVWIPSPIQYCSSSSSPSRCRSNLHRAAFHRIKSSKPDKQVTSLNNHHFKQTIFGYLMSWPPSLEGIIRASAIALLRWIPDRVFMKFLELSVQLASDIGDFTRETSGFKWYPRECFGLWSNLWCLTANCVASSNNRTYEDPDDSLKGTQKICKSSNWMNQLPHLPWRILQLPSICRNRESHRVAACR